MWLLQYYPRYYYAGASSVNHSFSSLALYLRTVLV